MGNPRRAYVFTVEIGADTRDDLCAALRQLEFEIAADMLTHGVSGGYSSGYTYNLDVDETITHDRYMDDLHRYLDKTKAKGEDNG